MQKIKLLHIITDLNAGGAETMLLRIAPLLRKGGAEQLIVNLSPQGVLNPLFENAGFEVIDLNMNRGRPSIYAFVQLVHLIRSFRPDMIQTWLYHADLYGSLATLFCPSPVIWGLHNATLATNASRITRCIVSVLALLSHFIPCAIISCSQAGIQTHRKMGYRADRMHFVPNGFDTEQFKSDPIAREKLRAELGLTPNQTLYGNISRYDPQKNILGLIESWGMIASADSSARFVLVGSDLDEQNQQIADALSQNKLTEKAKCLGQRENIAQILNAMDIFMLSSIGEAFPLVLGEAMSCETLCVSTDVGDVAFLLNNPNVTVPPDRSDLIAEVAMRISTLPENEKETLRKNGRTRIEMAFSLEKTVQEYMTLYLANHRASDSKRVEIS